MLRTTIGISGGSASGKTTLANALAERLEAVVIRTDDYYRPLDQLTFEERCRLNYDDPSLLDHDLLLHHLTRLQTGRAIEAPRYDFSRHTRLEKRHVVLPQKNVLIEGIFALVHQPIRDLCHVRVFVETDIEECLRRRIDRDVRERGRDEEEVRFRFQNQATPMFRQHLRPLRDMAEVVVSGEVDIDLNVAAVLNFLDERVSVPA
jgi:uridine kinase